MAQIDPQIIYDFAVQAGLDPHIAVEQARQESRFNPNAISPAGAQGLMQFMPGTWVTYGRGNPFDATASLEAWAKYMHKLLRQFNGRYDLALAGYNSGENRKEYAAAARENRPINWSVLPARVQSETRNYVNTILSKAKKKAPMKCMTCGQTMPKKT